MIWLDAHLSPRLAKWITQELQLEAKALSDLNLREADDEEIFSKAKEANSTVLTKDQDFAHIVLLRGAPPHIIWLRCGNTSEERLKEILSKHLDTALSLLRSGEPLVEIQ